MSHVPPTEYVKASDLQPGDLILYAGMVVEVAAHPVAADWREAGEYMRGLEVLCTDASRSGRLFLYRASGHLFERIVKAGNGG